MIYNLGSINADLFYQMDHLPLPGETLAAVAHSRGLGGKGANQSVAVARAGAKVCHIGAVGADGGWAIDRLAELGVDTSGIAISDQPTGQAIINVDAQGENSIVLWSGANRNQSEQGIIDQLAKASPGDILLLQNETDFQKTAATAGHEQGMRVIYSAAPFSIAAVRAILPIVSILIVNELEAAQLSDALDTDIADIPVPAILITKGAAGAVYHDLKAGTVVRVSSPKVDAVDTTGAGDTFAGYFAAALDQGQTVRQAMERASAAAALKVTRRGTADAIPSAEEVTCFIASLPYSAST